MEKERGWSSLRPHDKILMIAPSGFLQCAAYPQMAALFQSWELQPVIPQDLIREGGGYYQWPNTPERRAEHLIAGLNDPSIKAIFALEGGEGALEVVELLKRQESRFSSSAQAKPLIGYSDIGQLHSYLGQKGLVSPVYGPTIEYLADFGNNDAASRANIDANREALRQFLMGNQTREPVQSLIPLNDAARAGARIGGMTVMPNSMAEHSTHRLEFLPAEHYLLMMESRDLAGLRHQLQELRARGAMPLIDGIVIGRYTDNQSHLGSLEDAILEGLRKTLADMDVRVPVYYGGAFGHAEWGINGAIIRPMPLFTHAEIQNGQLTMQRFRTQEELNLYRRYASPPSLADRQSFLSAEPGVLRANIAINDRHLPEMGSVLAADTRDKSLFLVFEHADLNTVHLALSDLLAAGKLNNIESLRILSPNPIDSDTRQMVADFQNRHMPAIALSVLQVREPDSTAPRIPGAPPASSQWQR